MLPVRRILCSHVILTMFVLIFIVLKSHAIVLKMAQRLSVLGCNAYTFSLN
uniref:Uncharacterized protein n=1 Tax=Anguilla anguilla TaxID=7936 RepID=A0A0E9RL84_ANGAN